MVCTLLLCSAFVSADQSASASQSAPIKAREVTGEEFDQIRYDKERCLLVLWHAHWHSKSDPLKKEFDALATYFAGSNYTEVVVATIEGSANKKIARRESVHAIPMVFLYVFGGDPQVLHLHDVNVLIEDVQHMLDHDRHHRLLMQERLARHAELNIPHPTPGKVMEFKSEEEFEKYSHDITKTAFVMFYAKWCSACKEVSPELDRVAKYFETDHKVVIGKVECDENKELCDRYKVEAYPHIMMFTKNREGKEGFVYEGDRDADHLMQYIDTHNNIVIDYDGNMDAEMAQHGRGEIPTGHDDIMHP